MDCSTSPAPLETASTLCPRVSAARAGADSTRLRARFRAIFGADATAVARAPGRVEFIGNHTDYNGGAVIGAAIDRFVTVAARASVRGEIRLATNLQGRVLSVAPEVSLPLTGDDSWANYILGVWRSLARFGLPAPAAFDLYVASDVPVGAGLSSSAALELSVALALLQLAGHREVDPGTLAQIGRHAENHYAGVPCGILDQGTSAWGRADCLVHIDCRGPVFTRVPFPAGSALWVFNTRERHALVDGLYAARRTECEAAARKLGVAFLTDLSSADLDRRVGRLRMVEARRARHIVKEHVRVARVREDLAFGDIFSAGRRLFQSHRSSQALFQNSTPMLDALVDLLQSEPGVHGARLTGGGFGGAVMAFTTGNFTPAQASAVAGAYAQRFGHLPEVLKFQAADGAALLEG